MPPDQMARLPRKVLRTSIKSQFVKNCQLFVIMPTTCLQEELNGSNNDPGITFEGPSPVFLHGAGSPDTLKSKDFFGRDASN